MKRLILIPALLAAAINLSAQVTLKANNIEEVLKAMTLEEKATLVVGTNRQAAPDQANGMLGGHSHQVPGAAGNTQSIPRLGSISCCQTKAYQLRSFCR